MQEKLTYEKIENWLLLRLAEELELPIEEIDPNTAFSEYGLSSIASVEISGDLETLLGIKINPITLFDYYTIKKLSTYLSKQME